MTQQLTIEQLKFARSIGAVFCIDVIIRPDQDLTNGQLGKPGFVYRNGWVEWERYDRCSPDMVSNPEKRFEIDFSPLEYTPKVGEDFLYSGNGVSWESRTMLFNDGITMLMAHKKYPANRWHYKCDDPDVLFRPLPTEEEVEREKILAAWKGQSLENAHDTEASVLTVGEMIDFMMAYRQEGE